MHLDENKETTQQARPDVVREEDLQGHKGRTHDHCVDQQCVYLAKNKQNHVCYS